MDPLSITLACVTLIDAIAKVSKSGLSFLGDVRNAKSDIEAIIVEFDSIKAVIALIADEFQRHSVEHVPTVLREKIVGIVTNCVNLVADIDESLAGYGSTSTQKRLKWAASGKKDIAKSRAGLGAHRVALELALEMLNMQVIKEIRDGTIELTSETRETKDQTSRILEGNRNIRDDVQHILQEISRLQARLPSEQPSSIMLQRYLDELSNYAESVRDNSDRAMTDNVSQGVSEECQTKEPRSESQDQGSSCASAALSSNQDSPAPSVFQHNVANILSDTASDIRQWPVWPTDKLGNGSPTPSQFSLLQVLDVQDDDTAKVIVFTNEEDLVARKTQLSDIIPRFRYVSVGRSHPGDANEGFLKIYSHLRSIYQVPQSFFELSVSPEGSFGSVYKEVTSTKLDGFGRDLRKVSASEALTGTPDKQCRLWYTLRTIKKATSPSKSVWTAEPVAVCHSIDIDTCNSFWLTIQEPDETKYGAYEAFLEEKRHSKNATFCGPSLEAALKTQLLFLSLAEANWEYHIADLQDNLSKTIKKSEPTSVNPRLYYYDTSADDDAAVDEKGQEVIQKFNDSVQGVFSAIWNYQKHGQSIRQRVKNSRERRSMKTKADEKRKRQLDAELERYLSVDAVKIWDKQDLHRIASQVQDGLLHLQLNLTVLRETKSHYQNVVDHMLPPGPTRDRVQIEVKGFLSSAAQIETNLAIQHRKLETLDQHVRDGISLWDSILQFHSLQVSKIFNERSQVSAARMEQIATRTEQETASMHVITLVTLLFLPGTFVATFFTSDMFPLELLEGDLGELSQLQYSYFVRGAVLLILLTTVVWVGFFSVSRRRKLMKINMLEKEEAWKTV